MSVHLDYLQKIRKQLDPHHATLVAVSKTKPGSDILKLYEEGQRIFGENYVQELLQKQEALPKDIQWHFIGHLQRNKVKYITSFISMIHGVDNLKLLKEVNKQAAKAGRMIDCLLQIHIATEGTKFGLNEQEYFALLEEVKRHPEDYAHVRLCGLMGMATNTEDKRQVKKEFHSLRALLEKTIDKYQDDLKDFSVLSMGMSKDYEIALEEGSTLVRIGSLLFGARDYSGAR